MAYYWIAFAIELVGVALIAGSITRIVARLRRWPRKRAFYSAYFLYWLIYLLGLLVPRSFLLHFHPHPFADAGHSFGSDLFAFLLMVALSQLAALVAVIGQVARPSAVKDDSAS
jgi:hypothetical protein